MQLMDHITSHQLDEWLQSAFKLNHSTETALGRVQNDILLYSLDKRKTVFLLLLDLSVAFDTVDHATVTLVSRLKDRFSIKGKAQAWFASYLESRKCYVNVEGEVKCKIFDFRDATGISSGSSSLCAVHKNCCRYHQGPQSRVSLLCWWYSALCYL